MNWTLLAAAITGVLAVLTSPQAASALAWLKTKLGGNSSALNRDAAVKAYDDLEAYLAPITASGDPLVAQDQAVTAALQTIWTALGRKK